MVVSSAHCPSNSQLVDVLTKGPSNPLYQMLVSKQEVDKVYSLALEEVLENGSI